jgi:hypothetical protein
MESTRPSLGPLPCQGNNQSKPMKPGHGIHTPPLVANLYLVLDAQLTWSNQHSNVHAKAPRAGCGTTSANAAWRRCARARAMVAKVAFWSASPSGSSACFSCGRPSAWSAGCAAVDAPEPGNPGCQMVQVQLKPVAGVRQIRCLKRFCLERLVTEFRVQHNPGSFESYATAQH